MSKEQKIMTALHMPEVQENIWNVSCGNRDDMHDKYYEEPTLHRNPQAFNVEYDHEGASKSFFQKASLHAINQTVTSFSNSFDNFSRDNSVEIHNSVESKFRKTGMEHGN
jgi:hypothetical protein